MSFVYLQATQLPSCPKKLDLSKGGLSRVPDSAIAFPAIEELVLSCNNITNVDNNLKLLHRYAYFIFTLNCFYIKYNEKIYFKLVHFYYCFCFSLIVNKKQNATSKYLLHRREDPIQSSKNKNQINCCWKSDNWSRQIQLSFR